MKAHIVCHGFKMEDAIALHVEERLVHLVRRHFRNIASLRVTLRLVETSQITRCGINLTMRTGEALQAQGESGNLYEAISRAADELQLRASETIESASSRSRRSLGVLF